MAKKKLEFSAYKTVRKPVHVKFKTKSGETVHFKAVRTVREKQRVRFDTKEK